MRTPTLARGLTEHRAGGSGSTPDPHAPAGNARNRARGHAQLAHIR
jgi:hypothetical protein